MPVSASICYKSQIQQVKNQNIWKSWIKTKFCVLREVIELVTEKLIQEKSHITSMKRIQLKIQSIHEETGKTNMEINQKEEETKLIKDYLYISVSVSKLGKSGRVGTAAPPWWCPTTSAALRENNRAFAPALTSDSGRFRFEARQWRQWRPEWRIRSISLPWGLYRLLGFYFY